MESWHLLQIIFGPFAVLYCVMEHGNDTMISPSQRQAINNNGKVLGINLLESPINPMYTQCILDLTLYLF